MVATLTVRSVSNGNDYNIITIILSTIITITIIIATIVIIMLEIYSAL